MNSVVFGIIEVCFSALFELQVVGLHLVITMDYVIYTAWNTHG